MPSRAPCPPGCGCRKHAPRDKRQPAWPEWWLAPCGTIAAARRHYRRGEKPCDACLRANRLRNAERSGSDPWAFQRNSTAEPDRREVRNGLPEFRPYRYRGLGFDQLTAWMDDLEEAS